MGASRVILGLSAVSLVTATPAGPAIPAEKFDIDPSHSEVGFQIRFMGLTNVRGRFDDYAGTIMFLESDIARSTVSIVIQAKSIDTGTEFRDNDLRGSSFFAVDSFPLITFRSASIQASGSDFIVRGPFTMRGVTRDVAIPFTVQHRRMKDAWGNTRIGFAGKLKLNRRDYGISGTNFWNQFVDLSRMALADTVEIELVVQGSIPNYARWNFGAQAGKRSLGEALMATITQGGIEAARQRLATLKRDSAAAYSVGEAQLNLLGYKLMEQGKLDEALAVFRWNAEAFPESPNVYDSLGEVYTKRGERVPAIENYRRVLSINAGNVGAAEMLRWLDRG